jgi:hypothetical protein
MIKSIKETIMGTFGDKEILKKISKTAIKMFPKRVCGIAFCFGYLTSLVFYGSIPAYIFVMGVWIYLLYSTWQKTKQAIIEEEEEKNE